MHMCSYSCVYVREYIYTYVQTKIYIYIYLYIYISHMHIYNVYKHTYIYTYIHTYLQTYIHTYNIIHTYIHTWYKMTSLYRNNKNICHHFTGYQSCIRTLMVPGSSLLQINVLPNSFHRYLLLVLKSYLYIKKQYCSGIYKNTGVNCFWIIDNSMEVIDRLRNINRTSSTKGFDSFDFSTL